MMNSRRLRVVLDTNVIVAALRSRRGASFLLLELLSQGKIRIVLNAPLVEEYEEVIRRPMHRRMHGLAEPEIYRFLRGLIAAADIVETPPDRRIVLVRDPDDAIVAEAAIEGNADHLVTHNIRHFAEVADRVSVVTPGSLLRIMAE
jgi:putative PIN family toxin of toxin-antitoxin system